MTTSSIIEKFQDVGCELARLGSKSNDLMTVILDDDVALLLYAEVHPLMKYGVSSPVSMEKAWPITLLTAAGQIIFKRQKDVKREELKYEYAQAEREHSKALNHYREILKTFGEMK